MKWVKYRFRGKHVVCNGVFKFKMTASWMWGEFNFNSPWLKWGASENLVFLDIYIICYNLCLIWCMQSFLDEDEVFLGENVLLISEEYTD